MKQDVTKHINLFFEKLRKGLTEKLEVEMIHFHTIIDERRYRVLKMRVIDKLTYEKIGKREGVSRARVRQITHGTIHKLLKAAGRKDEYWDITPYLFQQFLNRNLESKG